ncbi:hypothetical protein H9P43_007382 [Blastocladiella emersonii ATCC 22665]|nr:hypothetical protein H9P43_007382 [Blastocladiella emersonii ATCC 22665]
MTRPPNPNPHPTTGTSRSAASSQWDLVDRPPPATTTPRVPWTQRPAACWRQLAAAVHDKLWLKSVPRRRSNFAPPIDPHFFGYLLAMIVSTVALALLVLPAIPPDEWAVSAVPAGAAIASALPLSSGAAAPLFGAAPEAVVASSSSFAVGVGPVPAAARNLWSGSEPGSVVRFAPLPTWASSRIVPQSSSLASRESVVVETAAEERAPTPSSDTASPPTSSPPRLPAGYFSAVQPHLRPLVLYFMFPSIAACALLTLVVGHMDVEDSAAARAPLENRVPLLDVYGPLMADDHFCRVCQVVVGARTRHCRRCNVCVAEFDHHCQFLNCCISGSPQRNYRPFFALITLGNATLYAGAFAAVHLAVLHAQAPHLASAMPGFPFVGPAANGHGSFNAAILLGILGAFFAVAGCLVSWLVAFHVRLRVCGNLTTFEWLVRDRDRKLAKERAKQLPDWAHYPSDANLDVNPWTLEVPLEMLQGASAPGSRTPSEKAASRAATPTNAAEPAQPVVMVPSSRGAGPFRVLSTVMSAFTRPRRSD